jgi:hypothetical protein
VVFVDESAELVSADSLVEGRRVGGVGRFGSEQRERSIWVFAVVVGCVGAQDVFEVAAEDQEPVETLGADSADEALGMGVGLWRARIGVWITSIPSLRKTSSKAALNLLSRSWIRNRVRSKTPVKTRLRACCVTQAPVGWWCSQRGGRDGCQAR